MRLLLLVEDDDAVVVARGVDLLHVAAALSGYFRRARTDGIRPPTSLVAAAARLASESPGAAGSGQESPTFATTSEVADAALVPRTEAARELRVSLRSFDRLSSTGALPVVRVGRRVCVRRSVLETFGQET